MTTTIPRSMGPIAMNRSSKLGVFRIEDVEIVYARFEECFCIGEGEPVLALVDPVLPGIPFELHAVLA